MLNAVVDLQHVEDNVALFLVATRARHNSRRLATVERTEASSTKRSYYENSPYIGPTSVGHRLPVLNNLVSRVHKLFDHNDHMVRRTNDIRLVERAHRATVYGTSKTYDDKK